MTHLARGKQLPEHRRGRTQCCAYAPFCTEVRRDVGGGCPCLPLPLRFVRSVLDDGDISMSSRRDDSPT